MLSKAATAVKAGWHWQLAALIAGAVTTFSLAPFNIWPLAIVSLAVLAFILQGKNTAQMVAACYLFAYGMFISGIHWLVVPLSQYSPIPLPVAIIIVMVGTAGGVAIFFLLPSYLFARWCAKHPLCIWLGLPALWVVTEWLRTWLFTGFPWLFLGYGHLNTWLAGWAPVTGVFGLSFIISISASTIVFCWFNRQKKLLAGGAASLCIALWIGGFLLKQINWTENYAEPVNVGLAQANIPQLRKWDEDFRQPTLDRFYALTNELWDNDWIIWPEAAIPLYLNYWEHADLLNPLIDDLRKQAIKNNAAFISGILTISDGKAYNSLFATGLGAGIYYKRRLVPFGEYVPLQQYLGGLLSLFKIQGSQISMGPDNQRGLQIGNAMLSPAICYEIVYPDLVGKSAIDSNILITVSNDAWFGKSIAPYQHMQMARMRALETGRYLIRGTNDGVSALVDDRGNIIVKTERHVMAAIEGEVELRQGSTPFMLWGSEPIVFLCLLTLGILGFLQHKKLRHTK